MQEKWHNHRYRFIDQLHKLTVMYEIVCYTAVIVKWYGVKKTLLQII